MKKFITKALLYDSEEYVYYAGRVSTLGSKLAAEIGDITNFVVNDVEEAGYIINEEMESRATVWIGSFKALTPLHHDEMHNFYIQIYGEKKFTLYPAESWKNLYLFPKYHIQHRNSQVSKNLSKLTV